MSYASVAFEGFGKGLNLRDKPDAVDPAECIDAMNVFFTERGAIRQRDGYASFASVAGVTSMEPFYWSGPNQILAGTSTSLRALSSSGGTVGSVSGLGSGVWDFARAGDPGAETAFAGNGANSLHRWDGTNWQSLSDSPQARYITMMPVSQGNRLVACGLNEGLFGPGSPPTVSHPSRVHFSGPLELGGGLTWDEDDWLELSPGDGERIMGVITWREFTVVFKETRFFVFTGTSLDSAGNPVFDYRTVDAGVGLASPRAFASHHTGIYFMGREGLYRFTGGEPEQLSSLVDPIFLGGASSFYRGGSISHPAIENCVMTVHQENVYLAFPTNVANDRLLVYDPGAEWFSLYDIPAAALATFRISGVADLLFADANSIQRHSPNLSTDAGAAINSRWRSGWFDIDSADQKVVRETKLWGSGKVFYGLGHDFNGDTGTLDQLNFSESQSKWNVQKWNSAKWGHSEILAPYLRRRAVRGTTFSASLMNNVSGQPWAVHRMEHALRNAPSRRVSVTAA